VKDVEYNIDRVFDTRGTTTDDASGCYGGGVGGGGGGGGGCGMYVDYLV
jgi:hypothetical protein